MPTSLARRRKKPDQTIREPSYIVGQSGKIHAILGEAGDEMIDIEPVKKYQYGGAALVAPPAAGSQFRAGGGNTGLDDLRRRRLELSRTYLGAQQAALGGEQADYAALQQARANAPEQQRVALARRNQAISDQDYAAFGVAPAEVDTPVTPGTVGIRQRIRSQEDILREQLADRAQIRGFGLGQAGLTRQAGELSLDEEEARLGQQERNRPAPLTRSPSRPSSRKRAPSVPKPGRIRNVEGYGFTRYEHGGSALVDVDDDEEDYELGARRRTTLAKKRRSVEYVMDPRTGIQHTIEPGTRPEFEASLEARAAKREGKVVYVDPYGETAKPQYLSPREATQRKAQVAERGKLEKRQQIAARYGRSEGVTAEPDQYEGIPTNTLIDLAIDREAVPTLDAEGKPMLDAEGIPVTTLKEPLIAYNTLRHSLLKRGLSPAAIDALYADAKLHPRKKSTAGGGRLLADVYGGTP